jgi:hypothetical protein
MFTKSQVQLVIDNFNKVLPMATLKNHLHMGEDAVNDDDHKCGTIHCHGGWYAVATLDNTKFLTFIDGYDKLARDLGMNVDGELEHWARLNPEIWGNDQGISMFMHELAFKSPTRPNGAENLQDIINHWIEVRDRLPE